MSELIWLVRPPEPLSGAAKEILKAPEDRLEDLGWFIRTSRTRRIGYELARYCLREQEGCSMLIAGGRGAGKTTLIRLVVQDLIIDWRKGQILENARSSMNKIRPLVPLPIILHGPTLLDIYERSDWVAQLSDEIEPALIKKFEDSRRRARLKERALRTTITALYTHLRDTLIDAWDNAARTRHDGLTPELMELRAHLDLLLDTAPDVSPLRRIWKRAGFMEDGVLPALYPSLVNYDPKPDQAIRELHALAACAQSFLSILGQIKETQTKGRKDTDETNVTAGGTTAPHEPEKKSANNAEGRSLTIMIPTIAASIGVIAHNVATQTPEGGAAVHLAASAGVGLATLIVAHGSLLLSKLTLRADRSRRRSSYHDRALTVDVDWSTQRLERELPKLLSLVKEAGLAPIFVIDELDKIEDPFDELHDFLHLTKHIVRDQAAFLFLSNRDYLERIRATGTDLTMGDTDAAEGPQDPPDGPASEPSAPSNPALALSAKRTLSARYRLVIEAAEKRLAVAAEKSPVTNVERENERRQKATARTFYEHTLSLFYEPADFRHYFEMLFRKAIQRKDTKAKEAGQVVEPPQDREIDDVLALGTILAFRGRLSPFEFNKSLNEQLDDQGRLSRIDFGRGLPFFDRLKIQHLLLQVVAETIARSAHVAVRIDRRPRDAQMLYDALYYLAERIEVSPPAPTPLKITIKRGELRDYLLHRASSDRNPEQLKGSLDSHTLAWLFDQVLEQVACLAYPQEFFQKLAAPELALLPEDPGRVADTSETRNGSIAWYADRGQLQHMLSQVLPRVEPLVGLSISTDGEIRFDLLVDGFANLRSVGPEPGGETAPRDQLAVQVANLRSWRDALEDLLGSPAQAHAAAARLGVLPQGLRWEPVEDALERADQLLEDAPSQAIAMDTLRDLLRDLGAYLAEIKRYRDLFDQGMRAASVIALAMNGETHATRRRTALEFLDRTLPAERDPATLEARLRMSPNDRREWTATVIGPLLQRPKNIDGVPMVVWCDLLRSIAVETETAAAKIDARFWHTVDERYWAQWSWESRGSRISRSRKANLLDLVFAARHGGVRPLEPDAITPRLGLWSLLLFRSLRDEQNVPVAVPARARRDLGLDRAPEEPVLIVVSKTDETLSWRVSGKVPALSLHFEQEAPAAPIKLLPAADVVVRGVAMPAGKDDGGRPAHHRPHRPWMLAVDTAGEMPVDIGQLFETLGSPVSYVFFGPDRTKRPEDRPLLPDPKSLEALYQFALDSRGPETA